MPSPPPPGGKPSSPAQRASRRPLVFWRLAVALRTRALRTLSRRPGHPRKCICPSEELRRTVGTGSGEYCPRLPVLAVEHHRTDLGLERHIADCTSRDLGTHRLVLRSASDSRLRATCDLDGVLLVDGSDGRWAIERGSHLRSEWFHGVVAVVSRQVADEVLLGGHDAGVHIWAIAPLRTAVFAAQVRALVRRLVLDSDDSEVGVKLDRAGRIVEIEGRTIRLGSRGFAVFAYLLEQRGHWVSQRDIVRDVFGTHHLGESSIVRVHVLAIRAALGPDFAWVLQGKEGFGYRVTLRRDSTPARLRLPHARYRPRRA